MSPKEKARARARLLLAWADEKKLQTLVGGVWKDREFEHAPLIEDPEIWRVRAEPQRMWTCLNLTTCNEVEATTWKLNGQTVTEWQEVVK